MLEDHAADFIKTWSYGHLVYGEHGAESIHKIFRLLQGTCWSMQPATRCLQSILKEHHRLVHSDARTLKPVILKRKRHPKKENSVLPKNINLNLLY